jgi:hypothetical protein
MVRAGLAGCRLSPTARLRSDPQALAPPATDMVLSCPGDF